MAGYTGPPLPSHFAPLGGGNNPIPPPIQARGPGSYQIPAPQFMQDNRNVQSQGIQPEKVMGGKHHNSTKIKHGAVKKILEGYTFKRVKSDAQKKPDWLVSYRDPMIFTPTELQNLVSAQEAKARDGKKVLLSERYKQLSADQQTQVDQLIKDKEKHETHPEACWRLVYIKKEIKELKVSWITTRRETVALDVIVQRVDREEGLDDNVSKDNNIKETSSKSKRASTSASSSRTIIDLRDRRERADVSKKESKKTKTVNGDTNTKKVKKSKVKDAKGRGKESKEASDSDGFWFSEREDLDDDEFITIIDESKPFMGTSRASNFTNNQQPAFNVVEGQKSNEPIIRQLPQMSNVGAFEPEPPIIHQHPQANAMPLPLPQSHPTPSTHPFPQPFPLNQTAPNLHPFPQVTQPLNNPTATFPPGPLPRAVPLAQPQQFPGRIPGQFPNEMPPPLKTTFDPPMRPNTGPSVPSQYTGPLRPAPERRTSFPQSNTQPRPSRSPPRQRPRTPPAREKFNDWAHHRLSSVSRDRSRNRSRSRNRDHDRQRHREDDYYSSDADDHLPRERDMWSETDERGSGSAYTPLTSPRSSTKNFSSSMHQRTPSSPTRRDRDRDRDVKYRRSSGVDLLPNRSDYDYRDRNRDRRDSESRPSAHRRGSSYHSLGSGSHGSATNGRGGGNSGGGGAGSEKWSDVLEEVRSEARAEEERSNLKRAVSEAYRMGKRDAGNRNGGH